MHHRTLSTLHPNLYTKQSNLLPPHFGFLLIDEAAQASEPDVTIPLGVVLTNDLHSTRAHVTICGDDLQLGPDITSENARELGLDVSLLGRLMDRQVYKNVGRGTQNSKRDNWKLGMPLVGLTKNYRSCTPILMLPSTLVSVLLLSLSPDLCCLFKVLQ